MRCIFSFILHLCVLSVAQSQDHTLQSNTIDEDKDDYNSHDLYLYAKCNDSPVLSKASLLQSAPVRAEVRPEGSFQMFRNITGYRFTNPAGVTYEGITASGEGLLDTVSMVPLVPIKEHTWFKGYSWRVLYVQGCENLNDGHIGWAFFCADVSCMGESRSTSVTQVSEPDFIFFVVWTSNVSNSRSRTENGEVKKERRPLLHTGNGNTRNLTSSLAF